MDSGEEEKTPETLQNSLNDLKQKLRLIFVLLENITNRLSHIAEELGECQSLIDQNSKLNPSSR